MRSVALSSSRLALSPSAIVNDMVDGCKAAYLVPKIQASQ